MEINLVLQWRSYHIYFSYLPFCSKWPSLFCERKYYVIVFHDCLHWLSTSLLHVKLKCAYLGTRKFKMMPLHEWHLAMSYELESYCPNHLNSSWNLSMGFGSCFLKEMVFLVLSKEGSKSCQLSRYLDLKSQNGTPYPVGPAPHPTIQDAEDGKIFPSLQ